MSSIGTLYGPKNNPRVLRIRAVAAVNGLKLDIVETSPLKGETHKPEFKDKFPYAKVPAFQSSEGQTLIEGRAIARFVAGVSTNNNLLGSDNKTAAEIEQWISFADDELLQPAMGLFFLAHGFATYNKPTEEKHHKNIHRALHYLQNYLHKNTYLVGHRPTLADFTLAGNLQWMYADVIGKGYRDAYPHVARYYDTISHLPTVLSVFGESKPREENAKFTPPAKEKKEKAPKPAVPAAAAAPKAEKKKAKKEEEDEDDNLAPPEPKAAPHPCASLPPTSFILDEAKRQYSNLDTKDFLPWFYEKFDKEGFSIWRFDFKYNEELTQVFMSANQLSGFFTRLEASRKYVMGAGGVYGANNDSVIAGTAICRGKDWKPVLGVAPDIESYDVTPLDVFGNADDKKFFEENMAWEGSYKGKAFADGKFLK